jgi:crossover junction endodeoxyribonuclease RuvC
MRILGVDPGLRITGYGCLEVRRGEARLVEAGVIRLARSEGKGEGRSAASVSARLAELDREFRGLLERLNPGAVAVEAVFAHVVHPATAIVMGHARGVLLLAIRQAGLGLIELRPAEVKKSLTGNGQAGKIQVQRAVQSRLGLAELPRPADMADAIAIAWCAGARSGLVGVYP